MFINISNHPIALWADKQLTAASVYGEVIDITFPAVSPQFSSTDLTLIADRVVNAVLSQSEGTDKTVLHIMGEMTLTFMLVSRLSKLGFRCVASTTARTSAIYDDGTKVSKFEFVRFRDYSV